MKVEARGHVDQRAAGVHGVQDGRGTVRAVDVRPHLPGQDRQRRDVYRITRTGKQVRIGRLVRMHADQREDLDSAGAGDIVAAVGLDCASGDTFCGPGADYALESIFVPEPVIKLSIEPLKRDGADRMSKALERFRREDPTFRVTSDEETGQTLIAGMGQLHLEIYVERIRREYKCRVPGGRAAAWPIARCPTQRDRVQLQAQEADGRFGTVRAHRRADQAAARRLADSVRVRRRSHAAAAFRRNTSSRSTPGSSGPSTRGRCASAKS